jgi:hypothetical protein
MVIMISRYFTVLSAVLVIAGNLRYTIATRNGNTEPNLVTWTLWGIAPIITFFAQMSQDTPILANLLALISGVSPFMIVAVALKKSHFRFAFQKLDMLCALIAIIAIAAWVWSGQGNTAIILSVFAGIAAGLPTAIKAHHHPETEDVTPYVCGTIAAVITVCAAQQIAIETIAFPLYLIVSNGVLWLLVARSGASREQIQAAPEA